MPRFLSESLQKRSLRGSFARDAEEKNGETVVRGLATDSTTTLTAASPSLSAPSLKFKRVDRYYSNWSKVWKYRNTGSATVPLFSRSAPAVSGNTDPWQAFCFVVVRHMPVVEYGTREPKLRVVIKGPVLRQVCQDVMGNAWKISWYADPLELDILLLIMYYHRFEEYRSRLSSKKDRSREDGAALATVGVLLEYLRTDHRQTLAQIASLTTHGEITFDLLYAILIPGTILVMNCPTTGAPQAVRLTRLTMPGEDNCAPSAVQFDYERIDASDPDSAGKAAGWRAFGKTSGSRSLFSFKGTMKLRSLDAYPIQYHASETALRKFLLARGRKWVSLSGSHHMHCKGIATEYNSRARYSVDSRVMIDRVEFRRQNPKRSICWAQASPGDEEAEPSPPGTNFTELSTPGTDGTELSTPGTDGEELSEEDLILTPVVVYGFGLSDKLWLVFNVEHLEPIVWHDEAFTNLVLPGDRKAHLQSLVEAHNSAVGFDDFILGKGQGLVINLFGPPGVGKTLSAEATSEHVRRPLLVVGAGDLGTCASDLDRELRRIFDIAARWKAIVLIDEADVFLEERSLHDLERNAMVAVFLRHVEYYSGILFLTTNRVKTFDQAFLSRIHAALHFQELSKDAKLKIWRSFLGKAGVQWDEIDEEKLGILADRNANGRQIKNATRTAHSLATSRGEKLGFGHLNETLDTMDEFAAEFAALTTKASRGDGKSKQHAVPPNTPSAISALPGIVF